LILGRAYTDIAMPPKKKKHTNFKPKAIELVFRDDDQVYAFVEAPLGDRRFQLILDVPDEPTYTLSIGKLRGSMRRNERVTKGCIVLAALRHDASNKVDILSRYTEQDERLLRKYGELDGVDAKVRQYNVANEYGPDHTTQRDLVDEDIVFESIDDI